jgi:hypothetical protein
MQHNERICMHEEYLTKRANSLHYHTSTILCYYEVTDLDDDFSITVVKTTHYHLSGLHEHLFQNKRFQLQ